MNISNQKGVTIIELLVVLSVLGILASVAFPSYQNYIMQSRRDDAHQLLMQNAQRLQRCFTLEGVYNGACSTRTESANGFYSLTSGSDDITATTFRLIASPVTGTSQENDNACQTMVYEHTGRRSATGDDPDSCW